MASLSNANANASDEDSRLPKMVMAEFTAEVKGPSCTVIMISAPDFIKSFKNCIE